MFNKCFTIFVVLLVATSMAFAGSLKEHRVQIIGPEDVDQWEQQLAAFSQSANPVEVLQEEVGRTWYDYATNNQMGRMLAYSANGIHFSFMKRQPDQNGPRYVTYNYFDLGLGLMFGDQSVTEAVATGWGRVLNGQNDEALICMHGGGIWLWQDVSEAGYTFTAVQNPSDGGVFPGIALNGDKLVFIAQLANANWTGGDTILVTDDYMTTWTGYNIWVEPGVSDYGPAEMMPSFDPTDPTGNTWRVVYGPPSTTAAPNGAIKMATTTDFGASFTTELIWNDDSLVVTPTGVEQYIIENFNQVNSMYSQDGKYHIVYGAVQGVSDTSSTVIDIFPILYWNDQDRQMIELTSVEAGRPADTSTQAGLANFRPGNGLGNAYPHIAEGPNPGELLVVWQQWEDDGSGGLVTVTPPGGSEIFCTDIWYSYSNDGGVSWTAPQYLAGVPSESEIYPNIPERFVWNATSDSIYIDLLWMWDTNAGTSLFAGGNDPSEVIWQYDRFAVEAQPSTSIDEPGNVAANYRLMQNYPNPFNPTTTIAFEIQKASNVKIEVFNTLGEKVATVLNDKMTAGPHEISFDASNLASGVYVYRMTAGDVSFAKKMMLLK